MNTLFGNFDVDNFWENSDFAKAEYVAPAFSDSDLNVVEKELGYKLPLSYVYLMRLQNGGIPKRTRHRTNAQTSWSKNHIAITGIYSIGKQTDNSLCGTFGSQFWIAEWGYPPIGIYFADCPSAGHDMLCFDYRECGPEGDPQIVHVDQVFDYKITVIAKNFAAFIMGLEDASAFDI